MSRCLSSLAHEGDTGPSLTAVIDTWYGIAAAQAAEAKVISERIECMLLRTLKVNSSKKLITGMWPGERERERHI